MNNEDDYVSMSMVLDTRVQEHTSNNKELQHISNKLTPNIEHTPNIWIPAKNIKKCFFCNTLFTLMIRKHHCRLCGRVFCYNCSSEYREISGLVNVTISPNNIDKGYIHSMKNLCSDYIYPKPLIKQHRLCATCCSKVDFLNNEANIIEIVLSLNAFIMIDKLLHMRLLSHKWCNAINTVLSYYKSSQYKLFFQKYSKIETRILSAYKYRFSGHFHLILNYFNSLNKELYDGEIKDILIDHENNQPFSCQELICKRNCDKMPKMEELLQMMKLKYIYADPTNTISSEYFSTWLLLKLETIPHTILKDLMPIILNIALENILLLRNVLIPLFILDSSLSYSFYYELKFQMQDEKCKAILTPIMDDFINLISKDVRHQLQKTDSFISLLRRLDINFINSWKFDCKDWFSINGSVLLPWDYNLKCLKIFYDNVEILRSSTRPIKISLFVECPNKSKKIINMLIKYEDLRKDKLTMTVSRLLKVLCKNLIDINTYEVFPIASNYGWIEMVGYTCTLYDIKHKHQKSLQNFIMDLNPDKTIHQIRTRFIKTCVSSCVICYVLGVGDRHLENILVTNNGELLHIDFSYLFGDDPKESNIEMKITGDMLDMLGGKNSKYFKDFINRCKKCYKKVREYSNLWFLLFSFLISCKPCIPEYINKYTFIKDHIIEKLIPGETNIEADMQIVNIVERSSDMNMKNNIFEWTHYISNNFKELKDGLYSELGYKR